MTYSASEVNNTDFKWEYFETSGDYSAFTKTPNNNLPFLLLFFYNNERQTKVEKFFEVGHLQ